MTVNEILDKILEKGIKSLTKEEREFLDNQDNFTDSEWNSLYELAENTFVEENDSLKKHGAGAGLIDND